MPDQQYATGAHVLLHVNGRLYAHVSSLNWRGSSPGEYIRGIDESGPQEIAPTVTDISGTLGLFYKLAAGGVEGAGFTVPQPQNLRGMYFSLLAIERVTGTVILQVDKAYCDDQQWSAAPKDYMRGTMVFKGLGWVNSAYKQ